MSKKKNESQSAPQKSPIYAPLYEAALKYARSGTVPFHMPGHKMGKGIPREYQTGSAELLKLDLTEIPGLDDLHMPEAGGPVAEASELAAAAFGAGNTYFLVNGSTCGIQAAIMAICKPGDRILASRECHKSVVSGMTLAGAEPVFIRPSYLKHFGLTSGISLDSLEAALSDSENSKDVKPVKCVIVTRPDYYGICSDIASIARIVHSHGIPLIVDEAHGAHLCFNPRLPVSALEGGADIVIQSAHKTLPAVTQGAYLHLGKDFPGKDFNGKDFNRKFSYTQIRHRLEAILRMLQTSSPSYILMAYLDVARALMQAEGREMLDRLLSNVDSVRRIEGLRFLEDKDLDIPALTRKLPAGQPLAGQLRAGQSLASQPLAGHPSTGQPRIDPTRIVLNTAGFGLTGFEAFDALRNKFNIQAEMADMLNCVFLTTVADRDEDFVQLSEALSGLRMQSAHQDSRSRSCGMRTDFDEIRSLAGELYSRDIPEAAMGFRDAFDAPGSFVHIDSCKGMICKEMVVPYPPGVPAVFPGEIFTPACIAYLKRLAEMGGKVQGLFEGGRVCVVA